MNPNETPAGPEAVKLYYADPNHIFSSNGNGFPLENMERYAKMVLASTYDSTAAALTEAVRNRCDHCGARLMDDCPRCGAPQCCPQCCRIDSLESALTEARSRVEALQTFVREVLKNPDWSVDYFMAHLDGPVVETTDSLSQPPSPKPQEP